MAAVHTEERAAYVFVPYTVPNGYQGVSMDGYHGDYSEGYHGYNPYLPDPSQAGHISM